jgi:23S rRNA (adenine2503-C2)-methyltransferase
MRYSDGRRSICLSSQSGCPLTCTFCATGQMKFGRNLTASEILDQALHFRRVSEIDHAVFMGMGEPMMNLDNVLAACERLPDIGIGHRHTAISTIGWIPGIERLADTPMPIRLALSLHAADEALRTVLMPVNERYPLPDVIAACVFKVNLIPYNPTDSGFTGSSPKAIAAFKEELERRGVDATVRLTRGRDIDAACGQLAARVRAGPAHPSSAVVGAPY